jgi:ATP-binding cassette subfamily B protein
LRRIRDFFWRYLGSFLGGLFFLIVTQALALSVPRLLRNATDALITGNIDAAKMAAYELFVVAVLGSVTRIFSRVMIFNAGRQVEFDIRNDVFIHLGKMSPSFYAKMPLGQVMSRMVNDLTQVRLLLGPGILNVTNTTLVYIVALPLLFLADVELAFYSLLPFPLLLLLGRVFARKLYEHSMESQERLAKVSSKVQENLTGAMTVRAYRREEDEKKAFHTLNDRFMEVNMTLARVRGLMFPMMGLSGAAGSVIVLWLGGSKVATGAMTVGQFVEFSGYLAVLTWPTIALGWMISVWQRGLASMNRINEIFAAEPTIVGGNAPIPELKGELELRDLTFTYPNAKREALSHLNVKIPAGETVVIVGRTGSGKSTLLKVIARLLEVPKGTVFLDGTDVLELPVDHVRSAMALAPQEAFLFSRTIYENVAFGAPEAEEQTVLAALDAASFTTDVKSFPEGVDTLVGERGITLSGGQRQRTALARALLVDPKVLLLDDSLAAVDTETETKIIAQLLKRTKKHTTILATHRLAFAEHADRILVLEDGKVIEQGSENELLALGGEYARMHRRQRLEHQLEAEVAA